MPDSSFIGQIMAGLSSLKDKISPQPVAYSRLTRTPIFSDSDIPQGSAGEYQPSTDSIHVPPEQLNGPNSNFIVRHESVHALLNPFLNTLVPNISPDILSSLKTGLNKRSPLYPTNAPDTNTLTEGAAYGSGGELNNLGLSHAQGLELLNKIQYTLPDDLGKTFKRLRASKLGLQAEKDLLK